MASFFSNATAAARYYASEVNPVRDPLKKLQTRVETGYAQQQSRQSLDAYIGQQGKGSESLASKTKDTSQQRR